MILKPLKYHQCVLFYLQIKQYLTDFFYYFVAMVGSAARRCED